MEHDASANPPCYRKKDDVRADRCSPVSVAPRLFLSQDSTIQTDDNIRVKIAGLQVDAKEFVRQKSS